MSEGFVYQNFSLGNSFVFVKHFEKSSITMTNYQSFTVLYCFINLKINKFLNKSSASSDETKQTLIVPFLAPENSLL